ncbi:MAG: c-type cytochrome [Proteobacteria bacterium]|nr:c-type cytochrome [Pseudomonadota bacterium]
MRILLLSALLVLVACEKTPFKESKTFAGNKVVDAATLNLGYTTYQEYCVQCHGKEGNGQGPSYMAAYPQPRNFKQGLYKFANVPYGELPHDEDFYRIIKKGLNGNAMLPWDIDQNRLDAVTQYIKTFAPETWEGGDKVLGTKVEATPDPYGPENKAKAIADGAKVYHVVAQCTTCHRAYETKAQVNTWSKEVTGKEMAFEDNYYELKLQESEYGYKVVPPDFTYHPLRSIHGTSDIYQRMVYGVTGSGMPGWKDVVTDDELWALTYYVESLMGLRSDLKARTEFMRRLENQ